MTGIRNFEDIDCWKQARKLEKLIIAATDEAVFLKDASLKEQMRNSSNSVPANIAEGFERYTDRDFIRFLRMAKGSLSELQSHLYTALDRGYLTLEAFNRLMKQARRTGKVTGGFIAYLLRKSRKPPDPGSQRNDQDRT